MHILTTSLDLCLLSTAENRSISDFHAAIVMHVGPRTQGANAEAAMGHKEIRQNIIWLIFRVDGNTRSPKISLINNLGPRPIANLNLY